MNLFDIFAQSSKSFVEGNVFNVTPIPNSLHKIGKSDEDFPKFFVRTQKSSTPAYNLQGELLSVEYNVNCCLVENDVTTSENLYSIITLRSDIEGLQRIFVEIFSLMLLTLPDVPNNNELALKIEGLLSIFSIMKKPPVHKIQGLWAELLVIERSQNPLAVAKAWHSSPTAKYDFTMGSDKIEVKSTSSENRIHHFSLDQLNPSSSSRLLIASVKVRESAKDSNGLSVDDMYKRICDRISDIETRMHVYSVITETLGNEFEKANTVYFDYTSGCDSLSYYDYVDIPKISTEHVPPFVSAVKFASDITHIDDIRQKGIVFEPDVLFNYI